MEKREARSIQLIGTALAVLLDRELKHMKLKKQDKVGVFLDEDRIIITNNSFSEFRPPCMSRDMWKNFLGYVIMKNGEKEIEKSIAKELEDMVKTRLKKLKAADITFFGKKIGEIH